MKTPLGAAAVVLSASGKLTTVGGTLDLPSIGAAAGTNALRWNSVGGAVERAMSRDPRPSTLDRGGD